MKVRGRTDILLILCGLLVWFLADADRIRSAAAQALELCARSVIPAMFPFMVVSGLLVSLGFGAWISPHLAGCMTPLFRLPGCASSALLLGLVGGLAVVAALCVGIRAFAPQGVGGVFSLQSVEQSYIGGLVYGLLPGGPALE